METKNENLELLKGMSKEQRAALLAQLQSEAQNDRVAKRESYEAVREIVEANITEYFNTEFEIRQK